jgi:hypothetical protein
VAHASFIRPAIGLAQREFVSRASGRRDVQSQWTFLIFRTFKLVKDGLARRS